MRKILRAGSYRGCCRFLVLFVAFTFFPSVLFAGGGRQIITETADGIEIWQKEFDVSNKKKGTYNIIITGRDAAGNEGISGPFNLKVDPLGGASRSAGCLP